MFACIRKTKTYVMNAWNTVLEFITSFVIFTHNRTQQHKETKTASWRPG